jgi:signal transduction histidine kinase
MTPVPNPAGGDRPTGTRVRTPAAPRRPHGHPAAPAEDPAALVAAAVQRERARTRAWLHDTVLQTLELIAVGCYAEEPDPRVMAAAAALAADELRAGIEGELPFAPGTLIEQLHDVVERERGLADHAIDFHVGPIDETTPGPDHGIGRERSQSVAELVAAAGEALRNARTHAHAENVSIACEIIDGLATVTIDDDGVGFDPAAVDHGAGVPQSIIGRMENEGGNGSVESRPGDGTTVTLQLRLSPRRVTRGSRSGRR